MKQEPPIPKIVMNKNDNIKCSVIKTYFIFSYKEKINYNFIACKPVHVIQQN